MSRDLSKLAGDALIECLGTLTSEQRVPLYFAENEGAPLYKRACEAVNDWVYRLCDEYDLRVEDVVGVPLARDTLKHCGVPLEPDEGNQ